MKSRGVAGGQRVPAATGGSGARNARGIAPRCEVNAVGTARNAYSEVTWVERRAGMATPGYGIHRFENRAPDLRASAPALWKRRTEPPRWLAN